MSELAGLIERCERATGEEQGDLLTEAVHLLCPTETAEPFSEELAGIIRIHALIYAAGHTDAALALVERKLPGSEWTRGRPADEEGKVYVEVWWRKPDGELDFTEALDRGSTPLAIILALLRALDARP